MPCGAATSVNESFMPDVEIRLAQPDDLEATVGVWERSRWGVQPWLEERMNYTHEDNLRHFRDVVMREYQVWLAVADSEVVGLIAFSEGDVDQLYVEPRWQGRGVGSALLERAKELSPRGITLHTHQRNERARAFYEGRGFRIAKMGVSPAPESEPDVQYAWSPRVAS